MRTIIILVAALAALLVCAQQVAVAQDADILMRPNKGIFVSGTAEVRVAPNVAYVTAGAQTRAKDAQRASADNAAAMNKVMDAVKGLGITDKDIETVQYTLNATYEYPPNSPPRQTGYEATNIIKITVHDLKNAGKVIDAVVPAGANVVQDIAFGLQDEAAKKVRDEALSKASADAKAKAVLMAKALDVKMGNLISASESAPSFVQPMYSRAEMGISAPPTPVSPQQIVITATVNLVYAIQSQN
jgi:uncharacterized protein